MRAFITFVIATGSALGAVALQSRSSLLKEGEKCTNPLVRKEWRTLSVDERKKYLNAVSCMMAKPSKHNNDFPILKTRFDDMVMMHSNATAGGEKPSEAIPAPKGPKGPKGAKGAGGPPLPAISHSGIHSTANFLAWHRYSLAVFEDAIISECGWQGGLPYWNWHLDTKEAGGNLNTSPMFDPVTGFGGNGRKTDTPTNAFRPPGVGNSGGGCITDGPFVNHTLRIGPMGSVAPNNTRCLTRNFSPELTDKGASKASIMKVIGAKTFTELQNGIEHTPEGPAGGPPGGMPPGGMPPGGMPAGGMGHEHGGMPAEGINPDLDIQFADLHAAGHGGVGGEMLDLFNSANDPIFYQHHAAMDYFWALWQEQDQQRLHEFSGASKNGSRAQLDNDAPMWMGAFAPEKKAIQVADTQNRDGKGILCFKYEGLPFEKYTS